jgi:hypothetical protein
MPEENELRPAKPSPDGRPRRRWFRFSLRTMLIVVTALCVWLAWESSVVRERRELRRELTESRFEFETAANWSQRIPLGASLEKPASVSLVRRLLGDEAIQHIWYVPHYQEPEETKELLARLKRVFPEAELSERLFEPCHPGCFPHGTFVETPAGRRRIETLRVGDLVTSLAAGGEPIAVHIEAVFRTDNRLWEVATAAGVIVTTETQPLCISLGTSGGQVQTAGKLQPGDTILRWESGTPKSETVESVRQTERIEPVINLVLEGGEYFIASGCVARSKPPAEPLP